MKETVSPDYQELIRLPVHLINIVNETVERFVNKHKSEGVERYDRLREIDVWCIQRTDDQAMRIEGINGPVIRLVRVFLEPSRISSHSPDKPGVREALIIIPDNLITGNGAPPGGLSIPVGEEQEISIEFNPYSIRSTRRFRRTVGEKLQAAWQQACAFDPQNPNELPESTRSKIKSKFLLH